MYDGLTSRRCSGMHAGLLLAGLSVLPVLAEQARTAPIQAASSAPAEIVSLSPARDWRYRPAAIKAAGGREDLEPILRGESVAWTPAATGAVRGDGLSWSFRAAAGSAEGPVMLTWEAAAKGAEIRLEVAMEGGPAGDGVWSSLDTQACTGRLQQVTFEPRPNTWYRMRIAISEGARPEKPLKINNIGLYDLSGTQRKDYWLVVGASIQAQSIRQEVFRDLARKRFAGVDPVAFNLAVGGWTTGDLRAALPGFLRKHPHASYVCIHIGGNNVTPHRPYPGDAETMRKDITAICEMIREAGKVPILARLSYRAYRGKLPVPPESNGSGPYVEHVYDPLIREFCPAFFDERTGKGRVDAYEWFQSHPEELKPDGVHVTPAGEVSWNRLWVEQAGQVVYGGHGRPGSSDG